MFIDTIAGQVFPNPFSVNDREVWHMECGHLSAGTRLSYRKTKSSRLVAEEPQGTKDRLLPGRGLQVSAGFSELFVQRRIHYCAFLCKAKIIRIFCAARLPFTRLLRGIC